MHRIVFMGSPKFALPVLRKLAAQYLNVGIVTQPDHPAGRGRVLTPPPIKILADELNQPVFNVSDGILGVSLAEKNRN
jgi:methionyl-tRNA formyltransferase